ncbi:UDP-N-acetylmuramate dehydrogenase [Marinilactibacillus psychrotolerans]|uniref:UDP-N-acetylenolpyruvoylglucosamine reductase n=1 Tax=Marinilactibacillus psychrotolerans TaxID=191770 RepID=A0A5R9C8F4_9LACT|nr:UDP-N-acetylmuramate dehydrogenase [Marinilactibacillus psychrotolerans]TLQ09641.1 UDP-N-acetylmuramate dehydrogenase [Marinilactibacillus psychrotolerans]
MDLKAFQQKFKDSIIKINEPLAHYTYTKTGGPADALVFPKRKEEIAEIITYIHEKNWPLTILGNASNLIVKDGGIRGVTLILTEMDQISVQESTIVAQAGAALIDVSKKSSGFSLTGLEFACGIPGSVGGAVFMNAGAYDGEIKDVIQKVTLLSRTGELKEKTNEELEFVYRNSKIQKTGDIVIDVTFSLTEGDQEAIIERMNELTMLRTTKQPLEYPSCGSVFKRPTGYFTGKLIQEAGLQGLVWGGAQISTKHAGFIVNVNQATATDYIELIEHIKEVILKKDGVQLETEVRIIGEDPTETEIVHAKNIIKKATTEFKKKINVEQSIRLADEH